jgi:hypothetical protein
MVYKTSLDILYILGLFWAGGPDPQSALNTNLGAQVRIFGPGILDSRFRPGSALI